MVTAAPLLAAIAAIFLLFSVLSFICDRLDERDWRRGVWRAHQPRPFDQERDA